MTLHYLVSSLSWSILGYLFGILSMLYISDQVSGRSHGDD